MNRVNLLREFLNENGADWVIITDSVEARYVTGINSSNITLCVGNSECHLFTDFRYRELAGNFCREQGWIFHELKKSIGEELSEVVKSGESAAVQSNSITLDRFDDLIQKMPNRTFLRLGREIAALFSRKSEQEIEKTAQAAAAADRAFARWHTKLSEGMSELDAALLLEQFCRDEGSREPSFETIVLFGSRAALPHGRPSAQRTLSAGDTILADFGCTVDGFCSDMTRTFYYRSVEPLIRERYEITLKAQKAGVEAVRPGAAVSDIDGIVRQIIVDAGYGENFGHGTGHGVGLRVHEHPALNSRDSSVLQPGMIITVEPGIYVEGESGVRIEDLIAVTDDGCRILSQTPKELMIIQ